MKNWLILLQEFRIVQLSYSATDDLSKWKNIHELLEDEKAGRIQNFYNLYDIYDQKNTEKIYIEIVTSVLGGYLETIMDYFLTLSSVSQTW